MFSMSKTLGSKKHKFKFSTKKSTTKSAEKRASAAPSSFVPPSEEKGWVKRHDPNYGTDYYENTIDGRVTWTPHKADSTLAELTSQRPPSPTPPSPSGSPSISTPDSDSDKAQKLRGSLESQVSLKTQKTAVLGAGFEEFNTNPTLKTTGSIQSFFNFNPLRPNMGDKGNKAETTDDGSGGDDDDDDHDDDEAVQNTMQRRSESWDPFESDNSKGSGDIEMAQVKPHKKRKKRRSKKPGKGRKRDRAKDKYRRAREKAVLCWSSDWTWQKCLLVYSRRAAGMFGFIVLGIVVTLVLVYTVSPPPSPSSEPDAAAELARKMAVFSNCSCAGERRFLGEILSGPEHVIPLTSDLILTGVVAYVNKEGDLPVVEIIEGYIQSTALQLTLEITPIIFLPLYEPSLCGLSETAFNVLLKEEVRLHELGLSPFPLRLETGGQGSISFMTSEKVLGTPTISSDAGEEDMYPYPVQSLTVVTPATVQRGGGGFGVYKPSTSPYKMNAVATLNIFASGDYNITVPLVHVDFDRLYYFSTCVKIKPYPLDDMAFPRSVTASLSSTSGVIITGYAEVSGFIQSTYLTSTTAAFSPVNFRYESMRTSAFCNDPIFRIFETPGTPLPAKTIAPTSKYLVSEIIVDFRKSVLSNSTYVTTSNVLSLPLRGNPIEIEYDLSLSSAANTEGNGRLTSDWNIFGRPMPTLPPTHESSATVKLQQTQTRDSSYSPSTIAQNTPTYVDRNYNFYSYPSWMEGMTFIQTANEDNTWPGKFDAFSSRNLFCVQVDDLTTSSYVLMDEQAVYLPKWLIHNYKRLSDTMVLQQRSAWDEDRPGFDVWHRRLDGDTMPCFGMNGAEASAMYLVAFGDDPPASTARSASAFIPLTTLDPASTSNFFISAYSAIVDVERNGNDNAISLITIYGTLTMRLDSQTTHVPVTVEVNGGDVNFRLVATDVKLKSLSTTISSIAPLAPLPDLFLEGDCAQTGVLIFSTFPGEEGIQVKARTQMTIFNELHQLTRDGPDFDAIVRVPFLHYNSSSSDYFYPTEDTSALKLSFTSSSPLMAPTADSHNFTDSVLQLNVSNSLVTTTLSSTLTLNMNGSSSLSSGVEFYFDDFPLLAPDPSSSVTASFSGFTTSTFEPSTAPWISMRTGGVIGSARFYQRQIVLESFQVYGTPQLRLGSRTSFVSKTTSTGSTAPVFVYSRPNLYTITLPLTISGDVPSSLSVILHESFPSVPEATFDKYIFGPSGNISPQLNVKAENNGAGEVLSITTNLETSLSPTWLLPTQSFSLELTKELPALLQTLKLASSVPAEIEFTPHYHLSETLFTGSVDLSTYLPSSPLDLSLILDCKSNITIPSFSRKQNIYGQVKYYGNYYPETNSTTLTSSMQVPDGWELNDQVKLTSGNILVSGSFSDLSGWSFSPLTYTAGAEILLYNNPSVTMLSTTAVGAIDIHAGDSTVLASAKLTSPTDANVTKLVPFSPIVPATSELEVTNTVFDLCVSSTELHFKGIDCIDGFVLHAEVTPRPYLLDLVDPFGEFIRNNTVGVRVDAKGAAGGSHVISLMSEFAKPVPLSGAVNLRNIYVHTSSSFKSSSDVSNSLQIAFGSQPAVLWSHGASMMVGAVDLTLEDNWSITQVLHVTKGCVAQLNVSKAETGFGFKADSLGYTGCALTFGNRSHASNATLNVDDGNFQISAEVGFSTVLDILKNLLDTTEPTSAYANVAVVQGSPTRGFTVDSKRDVIEISLEVDVSTSTELSDALTSLSVNPAESVTCKIIVQLSNPFWRATDVTFRVAAPAGVGAGPVSVDEFQLRLNDAGGVTSSGIFSLVGQQYVIEGVTSFDQAADEIAFSANLQPSDSNPFAFFNATTVWTSGLLAVTLTKSDGAFTASSAVMTGSTTVQYLDGASSFNNAKIVFIDNLEHHEVTIFGVNSADLSIFLPEFSFSAHPTSSRSLATAEFSSKSEQSSVKFTGRLNSPVLDPVKFIGDAALGVANWQMTFTGSKTAQTNLTGVLTLENVAFSPRLHVVSGTLTVVKESSKDATFEFAGGWWTLQTNGYSNERSLLSFSGGGYFDAVSSLLPIKGSLIGAFMPFGPDEVTLQSSSSSSLSSSPLDVLFEANNLSVIRAEGVAEDFSTPFTTGSTSGSFLIAADGTEVFVRAQEVRVLDLDRAFLSVVGSNPSGQAFLKLDPVLLHDLSSANVSFSNFQSEQKLVPRGFLVEGKMTLSDDSALEATLTNETFTRTFKVSLTLDTTVSVSEPLLSMFFEVPGETLFAGSDVIGSRSIVSSLVSGLKISHEAVVAVDLPNLSLDLVMTVDEATVEASESVETSWSPFQPSKSWNPAALGLFNLQSPVLTLSKDLQSMTVRSSSAAMSPGNIALTELVLVARDYATEMFRLDNGIKVGDLSLDVSGTFDVVEVNSGKVNVSSVSTLDWDAAGDGVIVVKSGTSMDLTFVSVDGVARGLSYEGTANVLFDGQIYSGLTVSGNATCCRVQNPSIDMGDLAKVVDEIAPNSGSTGAAETLLLGQSFGVELANSKFDISSCGGGGNSRSLDFESTVASGSVLNLLKSIDESLASASMQGRVVVDESELTFEGLMLGGARSVQVSSGVGVKTDDLRVKVVSSGALEADFGLTLDFEDGGELAFDVLGVALDAEGGKYSLNARGETSSRWSSPLNLPWLHLSGGSIEVNTTSDSTWDQVPIEMKMRSRFVGSELEADAYVSIRNGEVSISTAVSDVSLLNIIGTVSSMNDVGESVSEIFADAEADEVVLSTSTSKSYVALTFDSLRYGDGAMKDFLGWFPPSKMVMKVTPDMNVLNLAGRNAGLVFGGSGGAYLHEGVNDGFLEVLNYDVHLDFLTATTRYERVATTALWRPVVGEEKLLNLTGTAKNLVGDVGGEWTSPFGLDWLTLGSVGVEFEMREEGLGSWRISSCEFKAAGKASIGSNGESYDAIVWGRGEGDNHDHIIMNIWLKYEGQSLAELANSLHGDDTDFLSELSILSGDGYWNLEYATYAGHREGVTAYFKVGIQGGGNFDSALGLSNYPHDLASRSLDGGLRVWGGVAEAWISTGKYDVYGSIVNAKKARVGLGSEGVMRWTVESDIKFANNMRLEVELSGQAQGTATSVLLSGPVAGDWVDGFGVKGLRLEDSVVNVGLGEARSIDVTTNLKLGGVTLPLAGNVSVLHGEVSDDLSLEGYWEGMGGVYEAGKAISFSELVEWWNSRAAGDTNVQTKGLGDWSLYSSHFQLSPRAHVFEGASVPAGMALKTSLLCWGLPCTFTGFTSGDYDSLDLAFTLKSISGLEDEIKSILVRDVLPSPLVNLTELTNDQAQTLGTWMDLASPMFVLTSASVTGFSFSHLSSGVLPTLDLGFSFYGAARSLSVPVRPPFTSGLGQVLSAPLSFLSPSLFTVPSCLRTSDCFTPGPGYCDDVCTPGLGDYYGECPSEYGMCYARDTLCGDCFAKCVDFQCVPVPKDESPEDDDYD
mmetsp:Transcript_14849/g.30323  ORF Transcript_14849/g.30323 Transcript_14849/m.30323 type:complete len:3457 (+) Transcript_14849:37-10407(+)